jgi:hypothetical protein
MRVIVTESYYISNELHAPCTSGDSGVLDHGKYELVHMARARTRSGINGIEDILQAPSLQDVMLCLSEDTNFELSELEAHETVGDLKQQTEDDVTSFSRLNTLVDQVLNTFLSVIILVSSLTSRSLRLRL